MVLAVHRSVLTAAVLGALAITVACASKESKPTGSSDGRAGAPTQATGAGSTSASGNPSGGGSRSDTSRQTGGVSPITATAPWGQGGLGVSIASQGSARGGAHQGGAATTSPVAAGAVPATAGGTSAATSLVGSGGTSVGIGGTSAVTGGTTSASASCLASALLSSLGKSSLLIGASMQDDTASSAPFDARYLYISGGFQDQAETCTSCASGCSTTDKDGALQDCSNAGGGCGWWGCWQWDQDPPGKYVVDFVNQAAAAQYDDQTRSQIPVITYYEALQGSGVDEGSDQIRALNDQAFVSKYFADFRLVLQKVGTARALLHLEPDLWGYASQIGSDAHTLPAAVTSANPTDCASHDDSVAGFARCLISMTRKYAPNAKVGLHASAWGTNVDVFLNEDPAFDVAAEAAKLGRFLVELGAAEGDFVVADMSDRDAGFYEAQGRDVWWDASNDSLPNFHQALAWGKALSATVGKPIVWWQIPLGNSNQNNTTNHYKDNRVDYLFSHLEEVIASNGAALLFGAGEGQQTLPETDGGNLIAKVTAAATRSLSPCP